jgi:carbon-monoxide dehydrogenase large subunit
MNAPAIQFDPESARFGSSRTQKRLEDDRLLAGKGLFSDDRRFDNEAAMVLVRSPHAHARLAAIDLAQALAAPGVIAAWTMPDLRQDGVGPIPYPPLFKRADGAPMSAPRRTPLAEERVFYVGHPVAAIVAQTRQQAQDAADLVTVEYEELPCVVDARRAVELGAPQVWPEAPRNIAAESRYGEPAEVDAAFARAAHVTELDLHNQRVIAVAMEPRCAIGVLNRAPTVYTNASSRPARATCWRRPSAASPRTSASSTATSAAASA